MGRAVLVTGVARHLGGWFARALSQEPGIDRVVGVDVTAPTSDIGDASFVRADIRNPVVSRILDDAGVDTVVHMSVMSAPVAAGGRVSMKEINVIGTMQLLAACQKSSSLRRLVIKSTAAVYGSGPEDPALFSEEQTGSSVPRGGWARDSLEVEGYVRGFSRRRPDVEILTLRFANILGPRIRTPMTDYFSLPVVPVPLGFDARLQFVHEDDAVEALRLATLGNVTGVVNVAGDGVLMLGQAVRLAGKPVLPVPPRLQGAVRQVFGRAGKADFSREQMRFLSFGRALDTTRMRDVLGLEPRYTTREAFVDFVAAQRLHGLLSPGVVHAGERRLLALLPGARPRLRVTGPAVRGARSAGRSAGRPAATSAGRSR